MKKPLEKNAPSVFQRAIESVKKTLNSLSDNQKFWLLFVLFTILTAVLIQNPLWERFEAYREGDILRESIISPSDITFVDEKETERLRQEARNKTKPIFVIEPTRSENAVQNFRLFWEKLSKKVESSNTNIKSLNNRNLSTQISLDGIDNEAEKILTSRKFTAGEIEAVTRALRESTEGFIYNDSDRKYLQTEVLVFDQQRPSQQSIQALPESNWLSLSKAREKLKERIYNIKTLSEKEKQAFYTILEKFVQPTVFYDAEATEKARAVAAEAINPIVISLKRQQKIASEGEIITPEILSKINAISSYTKSHRKWNRFFGILIVLTALYWIAWKYIEQRSPALKTTLSSERIFSLFGVVMLLQVFLNTACFKIAEFTALQNIKAPLNDATVWALAIPFAFTSLSLVLLIDKRLALFSGIFASLLTGLIAPRPLEFVLYSVISSSMAVYGIKQYNSRSSLTSAGFFTGLVNALIALAIIAYLQQPFVFDTVVFSIACGFLGGIIASAVTAVALPPLESAFGILTDVKLLELSNTELPLLKQLALRAPGTNQHSHAVGQLAEDACRAIGANGLLAKIGALYHDIGKIAAPEHFVENQHGRNPHDKLKPSQSAKIIISHVTYGMKLAKEHKLPPIIADFIPQHHGTRTLHYFLKKAQAQSSRPEDIDENDFRYPGPKPQFKEAAIMMIADSCEAAARSLAEPSPENLRFIVTKIIDAILADDQLDECDLTLRELTIIRESMIRSLIAIYHSRVEYPGYVPPTKVGDFPKYASPSEIPISKGGEIEDEAVDRSQEPSTVSKQAKST
ncbi:MAG: HDIG domain-containing protein [Acidobacteria bacterium]|nr:MAG: HDIG domain-containing protein [Acidobacteriota bacterium]